MDYDLRIAKIETQLEMNQKEIGRLHQAMQEGFARTDQAILELRSYVNRRFEKIEQSIAELRTHTDQRIEELRAHLDRRIDEQRQYTDHRFDELGRDMNMNMRWLVGIWLTTMGLMASVAGKVFGLY